MKKKKQHRVDVVRTIYAHIYTDTTTSPEIYEVVDKALSEGNFVVDDEDYSIGEIYEDDTY
jgi:hypothetical protein